MTKINMPKLQQLAEGRDDPAPEQVAKEKTYFTAVVKALGGTMSSFSSTEYTREVKFKLDGEDGMLWMHWKKDGTSGKPVTILSLEGDDEGEETEVKFGRLSIFWDDAAGYAKMLKDALEKNGR